MTKNAPNVVRNMYRPMDPIRARIPPSEKSRVQLPGQTRQPKAKPQVLLVYLDLSTKWPGKGKPLEYEQQKVNPARRLAAKSSISGLIRVPWAFGRDRCQQPWERLENPGFGLGRGAQRGS
jgi:hypothetical protein